MFGRMGAGDFARMGVTSSGTGTGASSTAIQVAVPPGVYVNGEATDRQFMVAPGVYVSSLRV